MSELGDNSLRLLCYYTEALAHRLRTPLSVIVNDLTQLSAAADLDFARPLKKCREIDGIIDDGVSSVLSGGGGQTLLLGDLGDLLDFADQSASGQQLACSGKILRLALTKLVQFFTELGAEDQLSGRPLRVLSCLESGPDLVLACQAACPTLVTLAAVPGTFSTFSELMHRRLEISSAELPLVDAALLHCGVKLSITAAAWAEGLLPFSLELPRA